MIGEEAIEIYNTFQFATEEDRIKLDVLKSKFEEYVNPRKNTVFERSGRLPSVWKTRKFRGEFKWNGWKKVIPFEVLPCPRFHQNDRNFLYHLFGLQSVLTRQKKAHFQMTINISKRNSKQKTEKITPPFTSLHTKFKTWFLQQQETILATFKVGKK